MFPFIDLQPTIGVLLAQNIIPRILTLPHQEPKNQAYAENKQGDLISIYGVQIVIHLTLHSSPSKFQGSYSDSDFASLLLRSIFSDSSYLGYGAFMIVERWINSSTPHREILSSITIPPSFFSFLARCPTKKGGEDDLNYLNRLRSFLASMNRALSVITSSIAIGMRMNKSSKETLITSLSTLSTHINKAEHSFDEERDIPKEELKKAKKKIEQLIGMIESEDRVIEMEMDEEVSRVDEFGNTILHLLAQKEEEEETVIETDEMMKDSNSKYHRLINQPNNNGDTPLYIASENGHLSVVEYLIHHGADVNKADKDGRTPLYIASQNGHLSVVEYLIHHGGDVNKTDNDGWTALHNASFKGHRRIIEILGEHGGELNMKATSGWAEGMTSLHMAIDMEQVSSAEALIKNGADVNMKNKEGKTPVRLAKEAGLESIVSLLIEHGGQEE